MPRYFIHLSFKGTNYHGWQIQPDCITVQSVLDKALSVIAKEKIHTTGAGRTDSGVHASYFVAHFDTLLSEPDINEKIIFRLNSILPADIIVHEIRKVDGNFHARYSAIRRSYHYIISRKKNIFTDDLSGFVYGDLKIEDMNKSAAILMEYSDFTSFARLHGGSETNICSITESFWETKGDFIIYKVTADRFLRNMVRALVGTMIDIGTGKLGLESFREIINLKNRSQAGASAKAKGLFLTFIEYPPEIGLDEQRTEFPYFLLI
jgi:tRNA pseudouridine38-40 synthase